MKRNKKNIRNLNLKDFQNLCETFSEKPFRAQQLYNWVWHNLITDFESIKNLPKDFIEKIKDKYEFYPSLEVEKVEKSTDSTSKILLKTHDSHFIELVIIPSKTTLTACVSSQIGCGLDCSFCATATMKNNRNLHIGEIIDQVLIAKDFCLKNYKEKLSNIVYMGMGEPLLNYKSLISSVNILLDDKGINFSKKKITISTSGLPKVITQLSQENLGINLALSLHSAIPEVRQKIMPFSKKIDWQELVQSLEHWYDKTGIPITFEYIVWKDINDNDQAINELIKLCKRVPSKVNLIEYNSIDNSDFQKADKMVYERYDRFLTQNRITCKIRKSRGKDINAGCGQLAVKYEK